MVTILLCGVDLFIRGKLDALLREHRLITTENTDELMIFITPRIMK